MERNRKKMTHSKEKNQLTETDPEVREKKKIGRKK